MQAQKHVEYLSTASVKDMELVSTQIKQLVTRVIYNDWTYLYVRNYFKNLILLLENC